VVVGEEVVDQAVVVVEEEDHQEAVEDHQEAVEDHQEEEQVLDQDKWEEGPNWSETLPKLTMETKKGCSYSSLNGTSTGA